jgi:hypothetical protein
VEVVKLIAYRRDTGSSAFNAGYLPASWATECRMVRSFRRACRRTGRAIQPSSDSVQSAMILGAVALSDPRQMRMCA